VIQLEMDWHICIQIGESICLSIYLPIYLGIYLEISSYPATLARGMLAPRTYVLLHPPPVYHPWTWYTLRWEARGLLRSHSQPAAPRTCTVGRLHWIRNCCDSSMDPQTVARDLAPNSCSTLLESHVSRSL